MLVAITLHYIKT